MIDKNSDHWRNLAVWLKWWFLINYCSFRPSRKATTRIIFLSHATGFLLCLLGLVVEGALPGGLCMLMIAYFFISSRGKVTATVFGMTPLEKPDGEPSDSLSLC